MTVHFIPASTRSGSTVRGTVPPGAGLSAVMRGIAALGLALALLWAAAARAEHVPSPPLPRVLVIHSDADERPRPLPVALFEERLDRSHDETRWSEQLRHKYAGIALDVVIADGEVAARLLAQHPDLLGAVPHHPVNAGSRMPSLWEHYRTAWLVGIPVLLLQALLILFLVRLLRERSAALRALGEHGDALAVARDAAEAASRAKSAFLANMSHELRTPLNAIMGITQLALRQAGDESQRERMGKIDQASRHLRAIIDDILDLAKIETTRMVLEESDFTLADVLDKLTRQIAPRATEKGLRFDVHLPTEIAHRTLRGDPLRLGQILLNLAGNAVKFTTAGHVGVYVLVAEDRHDAVKLRFEVIDTGIGIAQEDQERLFTPFGQADTPTHGDGGAGLGLAICRRLVSMMDGHLGVASRPGQGSLFWFSVRLPRQGRQDACAALPASPASPVAAGDTEEHLRRTHAGARVLLAEDEPINREVSVDLLEHVGLRVDVAVDGDEAIDLAQRRRYALILMDLQMPRRNGFEAVRAIRAGTEHRATPILALTANAFEEDRAACLAAGMNDHLPKPVTAETLYAALLHWLDRPQEPAGNDEAG